MPEPSEGAFVGIDPVSMKSMNDDLATAQAMIRAELPKLRTAFSAASVETTPTDRLLTVGQWIETELPMLKRRQSLAAQLQKVDLGLGHKSVMVETEWAGYFPSTEAAVAKANELAAKYIDPGQFPPEVWAELARYQMDPDFAEAFVKAIGPDKATLLEKSTGDPKGWSGKDDPAAAARYRSLANLFATASHRGVIDDAWVKNFPGILGLMEHGTWDNKFLVRLGTTALTSDQRDGGNYRTTRILGLIARSPIAAAELYSANFSQIQKLLRGESFGAPVKRDPKLGDPLGAFVEAATVDARSMYEGLRPSGSTNWPNPAEELTRRLLMDLKDNPQRTPFAGVMGAYASIVMEYYDDLSASVGGAPVPEYFNESDPGRRGVEAPRGAWDQLTTQAMWDPKNMAILNLFFAGKYNESGLRAAENRIEKTPDASGFSNWQMGQLKTWFLNQVNTVRATATNEVSDYNAQVTKWVDYFVDPANAAVFATGGVSGAAKAAGKSVTGLAKSMGLKEVKNLVISWFDKEAPTYPLNDHWLSDSATWERRARDVFSVAQQRRKPLIPVTDPTGVTWHGQPALYEELYGGKFTSGGAILRTDAMDAAGKRAFAAWLQDPAVQNAAWEGFASETLGRSSSGER